MKITSRETWVALWVNACCTQAGRSSLLEIRPEELGFASQTLHSHVGKNKMAAVHMWLL